MPMLHIDSDVHPDTRTLADLAREALQVQDACNLSAVVHSFSRSISRLRVLLQGGTDALNEHPICQLWADKIASLAGVQSVGMSEYRLAYETVRALSERPVTVG